MSENTKWNRDVARKLAAEPNRRRSTTSVVGRVEAHFDAIRQARSRGMGWAQVAEALSINDKVRVDAVESAFRRVCIERGLLATKRKSAGSGKAANKIRDTVPTETRTTVQTTLFVPEFERVVDDGE